jgi:hypothetical protein
VRIVAVKLLWIVAVEFSLLPKGKRSSDCQAPHIRFFKQLGGSIGPEPKAKNSRLLLNHAVALSFSWGLILMIRAHPTPTSNIVGPIQGANYVV